MENKINIAEILKDCPIGTKLYSPLCGECKLDTVTCKSILVESITFKTLHFNEDGTYYEGYDDAECLLFPSKENRDWSKFQRPFKDGDIIYTDNFIAILSNITEDGAVCYHCYYCISTKKFKAKRDFGIGNINYDEFRIATADEKAKLFQAIKYNGYKWNPETKTLEKVLKIKDGDIIYTKTNLSEWISIFKKFDDDECKCYIDYCIDSDTYYGKIGGKKNPLCYIDEIVEQRLATEEEKQKLFDVIKENGHRWNSEIKTLVKLVQPNFKVGNVIQDIDAYRVKITEVNIEDECYEYESIFAKGIGSIKFSEQDNWKLISNKFDISTLKPFEKVLVRQNVHGIWGIDFFGFYNYDEGYYYTTGNCVYAQCIPYEQNKHLLGTTNDCEEFYKTWKRYD